MNSPLLLAIPQWSIRVMNRFLPGWALLGPNAPHGLELDRFGQERLLWWASFPSGDPQLHVPVWLSVTWMSFFLRQLSRFRWFFIWCFFATLQFISLQGWQVYKKVLAKWFHLSWLVRITHPILLIPEVPDHYSLVCGLKHLDFPSSSERTNQESQSALKMNLSLSYDANHCQKTNPLVFGGIH